MEGAMAVRDDVRRRVDRLFKRTPVANLAAIQRAIGTRSRTTVFRVLSDLGYLTSCSHAGRYYTLESIPRFDQDGLWTSGEALFSRFRTLRATIVDLVKSAPAGKTHAELQERLRLRVHDALRDLVRAEEIDRVQFERLFLYVSLERAVAQAQVCRRSQSIDAREGVVSLPSPGVIIEVLLDVIHLAKAGANPATVASRLRTRAISVTVAEVQEVFRHHGIEKKGARSRSRRSRH